MYNEHFTHPSDIVKSAPLLLSAWSVTSTLATWRTYPADVRKRTILTAVKLPYKDTPRSGYEAKFVSACRGVKTVRS